MIMNDFKQKLIYFFSIIGVITTVFVFVQIADAEEKGEEERVTYDLPQQIKSVKMLGNVSFAGEQVPMNIDTRERLDRELTVNSYYHSSTLLNIKMANKYFPIIEPILSEYGVPDDFKYLAVAESGLRNVTSPASAKGIWQIRKAAAQEMGLEVNSEVDERYHIEKATVAAAKYLKQNYKRFGSWVEAAAAYNMGAAGLSKAMNSQGTDDYFELNINEETSRYVFRLIALKEIMQNPSSFGFYVQPGDLYERLDNSYLVTVDKSVASWADFAKEKGTTYKLLKYYNPWLRDNKLTVKHNVYQVRIPRG